jgi:hypothetical protein
MVTFALVYAPGVTAVFARATVPVVVIGPPVKPVPVPTDVTVPVPVTANHDVFDPSVVKTFPLLLVCAGKNALRALLAVV